MEQPSHKRCRKCGEVKPLNAFCKQRAQCKKCRAEYLQQLRKANPEPHRESSRRWATANKQQVSERIGRWQEANPEKVAQYRRDYRDRLRATVFAHYGTSCACCGTAENLSIDHVNGDGRRHRFEVGGRNGVSVQMYLWLIENNFPSGFQTLCMPCNSSKDVTAACRLAH